MYAKINFVLVLCIFLMLKRNKNYILKFLILTIKNNLISSLKKRVKDHTHATNTPTDNF